ncbi:MAG: hypothetical protein H0T42_10010 [Deltaproteobacteria bacterium]|nr:hypothetical protein [Deltaproteobacteria bacterium]
MKTFVLTLFVVIAGLAGRADAYPQFQLVHDQTCSGCHISPAGGNLLNENGLAVADSKAHFSTAPEFFYDAIDIPGFLTLGGDLRSASGFMATPEKVLAYFPMQLEAYANLKFGSISINANFGSRPRQFGNRALTTVWSREHYVMWQQAPDTTEGLYVRAGRFMPVFGLRLAEHPVYIRRYGGTPLYAETYGLHVAYVKPRFEAHVTGFVEDPLISPVSHDSGGAAYVEARLTPAFAVGGEAMISKGPDAHEFRYGITAKAHVPAAKLLLQTEIQFVNKVIDVTGSNPDGGAPLQIVGYLMGSFTLTNFLLLDLGVGHYDSNIRIRDLDRDGVDMNLHYFLDSHLEIVLNTRLEMFAFGNGGPSGGYALLQLHYRL